MDKEKDDKKPTFETIYNSTLSKVKEKVQRSSKSKDAPSDKNPLHLKNATDGKDIPVTE